MLSVKIPSNSNILHLPVVYFLPEDMIVKCPTLRTLPRCFGEVANSEKMLDIVYSDQFLKEIADAAAALVFPHFGFGGWIEHYTGCFPAWQFACALSVWSEMLEKEIGWGLQRLLQMPSTEIIPFFDPEHIRTIMARVVKRGVAELGWQLIFDVIREMPCEEDFMDWDTNVRKDFLRKWYHTRSKRVQMVSLEACMEDEEHGIYKIAVDGVDIAENIAAADFCQRFKARLSARDLEIFKKF